MPWIKASGLFILYYLVLQGGRSLSSGPPPQYASWGDFRWQKASKAFICNLLRVSHKPSVIIMCIFDTIHSDSTCKLNQGGKKKSMFLELLHVGINSLQIYTERQRKLITSSGRRSLKSTLSKLIIFGHK